MDLDSRWTLVNRALCEITGYTTEEPIGRRNADIAHPEDVAQRRRAARAVAGRAVSGVSGREALFNAAGETLSAILSISLVRDAAVRAGALHRSTAGHLRAQAPGGAPASSRRPRPSPGFAIAGSSNTTSGCRSPLQRYGERAAVIVVDLDAFKRINDRYGHKVGDDTLKAVATALTRRLRETDLVARRGETSSRCCCRTPTSEGTGHRRGRARPRNRRVQHRCRRHGGSPLRQRRHGHDRSIGPSAPSGCW